MLREGLFWLSDEQWGCIEGFLSHSRRGPKRKDDRLVISGIIYVLQMGMPWHAAPSDYGPHKTLYNRFYRWAKQGMWTEVFAQLVKAGDPLEIALIDGTIVKAHQTACQKKAPAISPWVEVAGDEQQKSTP